MKSNGGVLSRRRGRAPADHHVLSGPAAGALGAALIAGTAGLRPGAHLRRRRHVHRRPVVIDGEPTLTTEGSVGDYPSQDPDDRRRHRRRRRRLDRLALARGHAEGRAAVGRRRPRPDVLRPTAATQPTVTDAHVVLGRIPPHLLGGEIPLSTSRRRSTASPGSAPSSTSRWSARATGILEISAWNQANALRQVTVARGLDVRDFTLATFGGSGSLLACRLIDILGLPRDAGAAEPGQRLRLRAADRRRPQRLRADGGRQARRPRPRPRCGRLRRPRGPGRRGAGRRGLRPRPSSACSAAPTCATSGRRSRCGCRSPTAQLDRAAAEEVAAGLPRRAPQLYGYDFAADPRQAVEWVNLRVTGIGPIRRPDAGRAGARRRRDGPGRARAPRRVFFDDLGATPRSTTGPTSPRRRGRAARRSSRSSARPCRVHPGFAATRRRATATCWSPGGAGQ